MEFIESQNHLCQNFFLVGKFYLENGNLEFYLGNGYLKESNAKPVHILLRT